MLLLRFYKPPIAVCPGVAQACSKVVVAWMWSPTDGNLSYLCLGTTSLLVTETFKFKNFETWLPATYNNGRLVNIILSSCLYWCATLCSCKYLESEIHLWNAQVNKASSANKGIVKIFLVVDMVRKYWSLWIALLRFGWFLVHFEFLRILVQPKDLNMFYSCFSTVLRTFVCTVKVQ